MYAEKCIKIAYKNATAWNLVVPQQYFRFQIELDILII